MKQTDAGIRLSPSDLSNHLACRHLTALDLAVAQGRRAKPVVQSHFLDMLRARGDEHEKAYVQSLRQRGLAITDLSATAPKAGTSGQRLSADGFEATRAAMASGVAVIVQAPLGVDGFAGYADILLRVEERSGLGAWSYEAVDTKLARETRGGTVLQLCVYSAIVGHYQGRPPERFHVVSPGEPFVEQAYRLDEFAAYYRLVRERLRAAVGGGGYGATEAAPSLEAPSYPEPTQHCDICRWWAACDRRRRADDHLSLVAGIRTTQRSELERQGVTTLARLAQVPLPLPFKPERGSRQAMERAREQARVQLQGRTTGAPHHELLPVEQERGLFRLPAPSPGDIFLDFEGDPFAGTSGLEYLFGWATREPDSPNPPYAPDPPQWTYTARWAVDAAAEKAAFEEFMAVVTARLTHHPDLHIYHYAPYEPTALKRLMGKYAVCEEELDRLLRGGVLVDLYGIARQAVIASVERYSLKHLEPFYAFARQTPLPEASQALRQVEYLLETGQPLAEGASLRATVESYNRDDCLSAARLRDWLERIRDQQIAAGHDIPRPAPPADKPQPKVTERDARARALMERLLADMPVDPDLHTDTQHGIWLLAQVLAFHRREDKAVWWEFYRLTDLDDEALLDEKEAVVGLEFVEQVSAQGKTVTNRYRYPPQEVDIPDGAELLISADEKIGTLEAMDRQARTIDIRHLVKTTDARPTTVISRHIINNDVLADALFRLGEWVAEHGLEGDGPYRAARELLMRRTGPQMDGYVLPVQGPPGAGKTYTGGQMILQLVKEGKTVGVCATSHKVIRHQIDAALDAATKPFVPLRCAQKVKELSEVPGPVREVVDNEDAAALLDTREVDVLGGTAWLWAREDMASKVDVLVVDEAGQMSLANVLAISHAAHRVILLGDPQQLEQPLKGSHPDGAAVSVLQHVLGDHKTMPADAGLFLEETRRMHPTLCAFTAELFYESKLRSYSGLERQEILGPGPISGAGLWYLPAHHQGSQNVALAEVEAIARLVKGFAGSSWINREGIVAPLTLDDILIVAPYNAQVAAIRDAIPGARAGTVDRFQGQEAPVVIYSLTTSSPEDAPRGMEFLYSLNRLNVATSRARCAAIIVGSPALFEPDCQTPRQMRLANALCRFREMAQTL